MTSLAYQIGSLLLPICLEETKHARELWKKPEEKVLSPQAQEVKLALLALVKAMANKDIVQANRALAAALITDPIIKEEIKSIKLPFEYQAVLPVYNPFTVIVITPQKGSSHLLFLDIPYIVIHGKNCQVLYTGDGDTGYYNSDKTKQDETRVATDEEVENCVMSLNPKQLRTIMTMELFAPIVQKLYEDETELVPVPPVEPDTTSKDDYEQF